MPLRTLQSVESPQLAVQGNTIAPDANADLKRRGAAFGRRGLRGTPGTGAGAASGASKTAEETAWGQADMNVLSPELPQN